MAKVLMVGLHPDAVDFGKWPGLTAEALMSGLAQEKARLAAAGHAADMHWIRAPEAAAEGLAATLSETHYDVVMIGAGVRKDDDLLLLFERLVNVIHEHAPGTRIAFNSTPRDTAAAIRRWV